MIPLKLIIAMIAVESGGNEFACGDGGEAYGVLQLHAAYVQDAAEHANHPWVHDHAWDPISAVEIMHSYMRRYATKDQLLRDVTAEDIARIHNGGPEGYKRRSTLKYWNKVKAELHRIGCNDLANGDIKIQL